MQASDATVESATRYDATRSLGHVTFDGAPGRRLDVDEEDGAALGHEVSATNLKRVLLRRDVLESAGGRRDPGRAGGRPAVLYRFRTRRLEITDQFAVLRPPG